jgi:hypothetical protein
MIDHGKFVIEEQGTQIPIDIDGPWENCFYPGQRVAMSMVFKYPRLPISSCPRCFAKHKESTKKEITW